MRVAIVILNYNGIKYLRQFIPSVIKYSDFQNTKVYIIDNGSEDNSIEFINNTFSEIEVIQLDKNYGFAGGYNKGLLQIKADIFVLLNSDVEVTENWLEPLIAAFVKYSDIACCMPKIRWYSKKEYFEYAGAAGGYVDKYGFPFCRGRIFGTVEKDNKQYDSETSVLWTTGACMAVKADLFFKAGGFDSDFFAHMEEIDLCWRLKNMGYKNYCIPSSVVYHLGGGTLPYNNPFKIYLNYRNNLFLIYKNNKKYKALKILSVRVLYDILAVVRFIFLLQFKNSFSVFKAYWDFLKNFKLLEEKKAQFSKFIITTDHPEIIKKDLIFNYFIRWRKTFGKVVN
jgi:GT2 family glycosyltransferase